MVRTTSGFSQPAIGGGPAPKREGLLSKRDFVEVRLGGTAAQGVIRMGVILAMAATRDHRYVAQTQTHGLEESDHHGHSDVIISNHPVDYPELLGVDLLVALCQEAADAYMDMLRPEGVFLYDAESVTSPPAFAGASFGIPLCRLAAEAAGDGESYPDLVALGAATALTGIVSAGSLLRSIGDIDMADSAEAPEKATAFGLSIDMDQWRRRATC